MTNRTLTLTYTHGTPLVTDAGVPVTGAANSGKLDYTVVEGHTVVITVSGRDSLTNEAYVTESGITYRVYSITCSSGTNPAAHISTMSLTVPASAMTATITWKYLTVCPSCGAAYDAGSRYMIKADGAGKRATCEICGYDNYDKLFTET